MFANDIFNIIDELVPRRYALKNDNVGYYSKTYENMRMLVNIILYCSKKNTNESYITDNIFVDCAYFKRSCKLVAVNNSCEAQETTVNVFDVKRKIALKPYEMQVIDL